MSIQDVPELPIGPLGSGQAAVPALIRAQAAARPERPFLLWGGDSWTYADLLRETAAFATALERLDAAGQGRRVASFLSNRPETYWAWFGTQVTGATYVALNRQHRGEVLVDMLTRSRPDLVVTDGAGLDALPAPDDVGVGRYLVVDELPHGLGRNHVSYDPDYSSDAAAWPVVRPEDLGSILFTSGTTGRSKAVLISHNQLCRGAARFAESIAMNESDRWHAWLPLYHIAGQLHMSMSTLVSGGSLALWPTFSRSSFWREVHETRCTLFGGFGNVLSLLLEAAEPAANRDNPLRLGVIAAPSAESRARFAERFDVDLVDTYGMTEAEPVSVPVLGREQPAGSCGVPNPDFAVAILDEQGYLLPPGVGGEISIRPRVPNVLFRGYEGDEAATLEAWRDLWFHTGDYGYQDEEGFLYLVDRRKHVIRRRAENISPTEVEAIICRHPHVADCGVVGLGHSLADQEVKAVVVPAPGASVEPSELHAFCKQSMARFMVPRFFEIRDDLPRSELGKLDREALERPLGDLWDAQTT